MVSVTFLARAALRYDTLMAWAMRRALGVAGRPAPRCPGRLPRADVGSVDPEVLECFRNEGRSPVEWG